MPIARAALTLLSRSQRAALANALNLHLRTVDRIASPPPPLLSPQRSKHTEARKAGPDASASGLLSAASFRETRMSSVCRRDHITRIRRISDGGIDLLGSDGFVCEGYDDQVGSRDARRRRVKLRVLYCIVWVGGLYWYLGAQTRKTPIGTLVESSVARCLVYI